MTTQDIRPLIARHDVRETIPVTDAMRAAVSGVRTQQAALDRINNNRNGKAFDIDREHRRKFAEANVIYAKCDLADLVLLALEGSE